MEPSPRSSFEPAGAGALLGGVTAGSVGAGALIGWAAGSVGYGILVGAFVGIPAGVFAVYKRYKDAFLTRVGILGAPRPYPERQRWLAPAAGALVIAIALPLFLVAGWPLEGWAAAALLWVGAQALGLLLGRVKPSPDNLAASGLLAFGMMSRLLVVLAVLLALVASDKEAGLAAALVYGAAYTAELGLSLLGYYSQEPRA